MNIPKLILDISHAEARYISISLRNHAMTLRGGWNVPVTKNSMSNQMVTLANEIDLKNEERYTQLYNLAWCAEINKELAKDYK